MTVENLPNSLRRFVEMNLKENADVKQVNIRKTRKFGTSYSIRFVKPTETTPVFLGEFPKEYTLIAVHVMSWFVESLFMRNA